jgi:hypothetical protein
MRNLESHIAVASQARLESERKTLWTGLTRLGRTPVLAIVAFLLGVTVMLMYRPLSQIEGGDNAIWDYISQSIARGQVPYRDVIENKAPGAGYLSALVMTAGRLAGMQDVIAVRLFYVLLAGLLCTLTYLVAEIYLGSRLAATIAFLIPLMSKDLALMLISGTRPKLPTILFGLTTLLLISKNKAFWAGFCSMLACICWQPGLLFTGTAVLIFSKYLTSWRDHRALKVLLGASVPLAVVFSYFYWASALNELWTCTIDYNYRVYLPEGNMGPSVALARLWFLINEVMGPNIIWVKLSALGLLAFAIERLWMKLKVRSAFSDAGLYKDALLIPPLVYLIFRTINYPGLDDLIPLFPFIGIFAGFFFFAIARLLSSIRFFQKNLFETRLAEGLLIVPILLAMFLVLDQARKYQVEPGRTLVDQQKAFEAITEVLTPNDKIYVHGTLEVLVLLNRPNLNRYIFLDRGKDDYLASKLSGGFMGLLGEMEAEAPKVISLSRLRNVSHRDELIEWASQHYDKLPLDFAHNSVYVRKHE